MSLEYRVYANNGLGGPVIYTSPIATTSSLSQLVTPLSKPSDNTFLIRVHDTVTGYEDQNGDARVRIVVDSSGRDVTGQPNAPWGLTVTPTISGGVQVAWMYNPGGQGGPPTVFNVYAGSPAPNYSVKLAQVAARKAPGQIYIANLTGLTGGTAYQVAVRAQNAVAEETNTTTVSFTAVSAGPSAVASLSAAVIT
jgi:hypothetical protein